MISTNGRQYSIVKEVFKHVLLISIFIAVFYYMTYEGAVDLDR
jgi:hypothetical protein